MRTTTHKFLCVVCWKRFTDRSVFYHHILRHKERRGTSQHTCDYCPQKFSSKLLKEYHINTHHRCSYCDYEHASPRRVESHKKHCHVNLNPLQRGGKTTRFSPYPFKSIEAFQGYLQTYRQRKKRWDDSIMSVDDYFILYSDTLHKIISHCVSELKNIKLQISLVCQFLRKATADSVEERCVHYVNSNQRVVLNMFYYKKIMSEIIEQCKNTVVVFEQNGSGWVLEEILGCDIKIARFQIINAGCFIPTPQCFLYKRTIINPNNADNECFKWAFLCIQHYEDVQGSHRERISQYRKFESRYDFSKVKFPSSLKDVEKFEKSNGEKGFRINVFGMYYIGEEEWSVHVMYLSRYNNEKDRKVIDLLYVKDSADHNAHYMGIVDINRLLGKTSHHRHYLCYNCLQRTTSLKQLNEHERLCLNFKAQTVIYPEINPKGEVPKLFFKKYQNKLKSQFVIYADFECVLLESEITVGSQQVYQKHVPSGFAFLAVNHKGEIIKKKVYRGEDCIKKFFDKINRLCEKLVEMNEIEVRMIPLTQQEEIEYALSDTCHICKKPLKNFQKTRDHCHITGKFRGAAHRTCNALFTQSKRIPIVLHNFKNYDQHLIIRGIKQNGYRGVKTVPHNTEKFLSIICDNYLFIDSMMFLATSLDDLVHNLSCDIKNDDDFAKRFNIMKQVFGITLGKKLCRKGVFPYEYIDNFSRFEECEFPPLECFYSSLNNTTVTSEDYEYGKKIFNQHCKNLGDYHDLYMLVDTVLLACVFENFREIALKNYELDPCRYFSLAGYAWDAALLNTQEELELITDPEMYNMIESGLRGGVSMITTRYANAYNKYMPDYVKGKEEDKFLFYIDKNNLYGEALLQPLPVSDFKWMSKEFVDNFNEDILMSWRDNSCTGYILMVDLKYPKELHSDHDEYPLMPEKTSVSKGEMSNYQLSLIDHLGIVYSDKTKKLIPHLGSRKRYVVHYRNLKYYVSKGVCIQKVHKIISFTQSPWLRSYVNLNAQLRREACTEFEKSFFKFMVNSIFGKSMEQKRNRMDAYIVTKKFTLANYTKRSSFKSYQIIDDEIAIVYLSKPDIYLDRPIYTAFTVLDISKLLMYEWHYDKVKAWYGKKAKFLFTDTDSLAYCIETEDLYEDLKSKADDFDFSDYPKDHPLYSDVNKKVIGKMKDEANSKILTSFVGLAPKMYSFEGLNDLSKKAAKGVKKTIIKQKLRHSVYLTALKNQKKLYCIMNQIRSRNHSLETVAIRKVALHCFDSKRFILKDGVSTKSHKLGARK